MKKLLAEFIGTLWLVLGGCGSACLAAGIPDLGIGYVGVSLAFGLSVLTMAYAVGHISGGHFNPAVTIGFWVGGKLNTKEIIPYIGAQLIGGILGGVILFLIVTDNGSDIGNFAINGYDNLSPGGYSMQAALLTEVVMTFMFVFIILGCTHKNANTKFAGVVIGLALTLVHLISIPITNTSVNPARSTSQALFVGGEAINQLWLFWVAPIIGAMLAGIIYKVILNKE